MENESDGIVEIDGKAYATLRIVMNRAAMTPQEQGEFLTDLSHLLCVPRSEFKNVRFTTVEKPEPKI